MYAIPQCFLLSRPLADLRLEVDFRLEIDFGLKGDLYTPQACKTLHLSYIEANSFRLLEES
jgi:hypothetical protein